ncbi:hypothetical protein Enr13x_46820 [Stieleria neptunia]|uniref:Uncharacterized protein n=1 Tax=Stieleria neptunia TaxID=2527979 RepID=A0A518HVC6_9BACT|nr:hypothetical protein Enr13x_46820 [Stieleria neptunia]
MPKPPMPDLNEPTDGRAYPRMKSSLGSVGTPCHPWVFSVAVIPGMHSMPYAPVVTPGGAWAAQNRPVLC